ncbi:MAG: bifunctional DNA-formamidopyrimidine glycosylase/DNA-(apurinic or apyrimidinic site) lyase [Chloroflexota bacterium]
MPELPEVETIKNDLRELVLGRQVMGLDLRDPLLVRRPSPEAFVARLKGQTIVSADRVAKALLIRLSSGDYFVVQLMITGQLLLAKPADAVAENTRLILDLDDARQLRMNDENGYAKVQLLSPDDLAGALKLDELGPDPTAPDFTLERFRQLIAGRRGRVKSLLLDQHFLAGMGNIYVDEALFRAGILPTRVANGLSPDEITSLYAAIREVLFTGIAKRGTTIATYRDVLGRKGRFQEEFKVFRHGGKPCYVCGTPIVVEQLGGRDTHFCPHCQR